jgi:hypothetical protein
MAFARLETSILNHPKFLPLMRVDVRANTALAALGLWTLGLAYTSDQLSDGRVPKAWVATRVRPNVAKRSAEQLISLGLWEDRGDHYLIHDYLEWNPSSQQIKADRRAARDRMKKLRGSGERSQEQAGSEKPHTESVRQQDVDVAKTEITKPRTTSPVQANSRAVTEPCHRGRGERGLEHPAHPDRVVIPNDGVPCYPSAELRAQWLHVDDGCPRSEHLERFPADLRRQCASHRNAP